MIVIILLIFKGMDPQARHATWTVLQKYKQEKQCSILLTTHFMDEADFLGDRIAIMSRGQLRCCGSPLYLKSKYDSGYNLVINKQTNSKINDTDLADRYMVVIQRHIPNARLNSNINSEISFMLPKEDASKFSLLFDDLDLNKQILGIINIGVSVTTVEEVFLKIGDLEECEEVSEEDQNQLNSPKPILSYADANKAKNQALFVGLQANERNDDFLNKYSQQFYGLLVKKLIHSLRNLILIVSQLIVPIACLFMILILVKYGPIQLQDSPSLNITLKSYQSNYVPFKVVNKTSSLNDLSSFYSNQSESSLNLDFKLKNCSTSTQSIDSYLSCIGRISDVGLSLLTDNYIVAATFQSNTSQFDKNTKIIAHFNNQPYHTPPLTLNLATNSLFKYLSNSSSAQINLINHPMPRTPDEEINDATKLGVVGGFQIASTISFGFSFLISSFALFLIKERVSNAKHMQYLTGASPIIFWLSNLTWDIINYLIPAVISIILIVAFDIEQYTGDQLKLIIGLFIMYGFAHIPQTYLISYLFKNPSTGFSANVAWNILTSQTTIVAIYFLQLPQLDLLNEGDALEWLFLILLPNFAFGQGLTDIYTNYEYNDICKRINISSEFVCKLAPNPCCIKYKNCGNGTQCLRWTEDYLSWEKPGLGRYFLFMPLQFLVLFGVVLLYELGYIRQVFYLIRSVMFGNETTRVTKLNENGLTNEEELYGDIPKDEDVLSEEKRIAYEKNDLLCIDGLTKYYSNFMAVKGISLGIKNGECFGLLGYKLFNYNKIESIKFS